VLVVRSYRRKDANREDEPATYRQDGEWNIDEAMALRRSVEGRRGIERYDAKAIRVRFADQYAGCDVTVFER
jgi:hypothetical protein